jgi:hypothetical protein
MVLALKLIAREPCWPGKQTLHRRRGDLLAQTDALGDAFADRADLGAVRRAAEELLVGLQEIETAETDLVLESVNTELGVGDRLPPFTDGPDEILKGGNRCRSNPSQRACQRARPSNRAAPPIGV